MTIGQSIKQPIIERETKQIFALVERFLMAM